VVTLWEDMAPAGETFDIEDFDDTLNQLAKFEPEGAKVIELRFYAGLTLPEISDVLELSERTVQRRWRTARAWMLKELTVAA